MADTPAGRSDPAPLLAAAVRRRFGEAARVENLKQATLGGSNRTILFDLVEGTVRRRLVSREETFAGEVNPFLSPHRQFETMRVAFGAGLAVPEPMFEYDASDALGPGFVTGFAPGETLPRRLIADTTQHAAMLASIADGLARLHALPADRFTFLEPVAESGEPMATLAARIDSLEEPHPALELGLRWLDRHRPPSRQRGIVHGDFRMGNLMIERGAVTALLDWECAHLGSPVEDLGWFCTRSWRFGQVDAHAGGIATRAELIAAYQAAGGGAVEADEVRWWEMFGLVRWGMYNVLQAFGHERGRRSAAYAVCGRNVALMEYDLLMTLTGRYD